MNDFAAYVRGDHPDVVSYHRYVLGQVRAALIRAKLLEVEITTIGVALKDGWMGPDEALEALAAACALDFLLPTEPEYERDRGPHDPPPNPAPGPVTPGPRPSP